MSQTLDAFLPHVLPYAPGCSDLAAYQAIRDAAIDFCRRTGVVQRVSTNSVVAGTQDYTITVVTDMQLAAVQGAAYQGTWLTPVSPDQVESDTALRGVTIGTAVPQAGTPIFYFQKTPDVAALSLYPIPDTSVTTGLTVKASFMPTQTAATLDDLLLNDYAEAIGAGALTRLLAMPGQMFSGNPAPYLAAYERHINNAKRLKQRGKLPSNLRVNGQRFV